MSNTNEPWFVLERSEALAGALLTSRKDVDIRDERKHDSGLDFLVEIFTGDPISTQLFLVEVRVNAVKDVPRRCAGVPPLGGFSANSG